MRKTKNLTKINFALCLLIVVVMALGVGLAFSGKDNSLSEHSGVGASAQQAATESTLGANNLQSVALAERTLTLVEKTAVFTGAAIAANTAIPSAGGGAITYEYFESATGGTAVGISLGATAPTNVGVYWAQASIAADTTYVTVKSAQVKLIIEKANAIVTLPTVPDMEFSNAPYVHGVTATAKKVIGDGGGALTGAVTYNYYANTTANTKGALLNSAPSAVGKYWIEAAIAAEGNYAASVSAAQQFVIKKATVTMNFTAEAYEIPYKGAVVGVEGAHVATVNLVGGVVATGVITYEFYPSASFIPSELIGAPENVGVYYVKAKLSGDTNYADVTSDTYKTITITAVDITTFKLNAIADITYDGTEVNVSQYLTIVGTNGKAPTGAVSYKYYANSSDTKGELLTAIPTNVAVYWVEAVIAADGNYKAKISPAIKFSLVQGTLTAKTAPTAGTIYIPQKVSDSVITAGVIHNADGGVVEGVYTWSNNATESPAAGTYTKYKILFTPTNSNYKALEMSEVTLKVLKLTINFSGENGVVANSLSLSNGANINYGSRVTFTPRATVGYTFTKWIINGVDGGVATTLTIDITEKNNTIVGVCTANTDTKYIVNHKLQDLGKLTYTETEKDTLAGTTDTSITITPKVFEGFTAPTTGLTYTIKGDGSLVIDLLYTRNKYNVTIDGGATMQKEFGANIYLAPSAEHGYVFGGWANNQGVTMSGNEYVVIAKDIVFTSIMNLEPATVTISSVGASKTYDGAVVTITANPTHTLTTGLTYSYAWYKGAELIVGETNKTLTLPGNVADSATYKVVVTSTATADGKTSTAEMTQAVAITKKDVNIAGITYENMVVQDGKNTITIHADGTIKQVVTTYVEGVMVKYFTDSARTIPFNGAKFGAQDLYITYVADGNHTIIDTNVVNEVTYDVQGFVVDIKWNILPTYTYSGKALSGVSAKYTDRSGKEITVVLGAGMKFTQNGKEVAFKDAGMYNVTIDIGGCLPSATSTTTQVITIEQKNIDISNMKFLDVKKMFTGEEFAFTVFGSLDENVAVGYYYADGSPFVSVKNVGTYVIKAVFSPKDAKNYKISGISNNTLTATIDIAYDVVLENAFNTAVAKIGAVDANSFNIIKLAIIQYARLPYTGNVTEAKAILDTKIAEYNAIITATNDCMDEAKAASRKMFDGVAAALSALAAAYVVSKFRLV